MSFSKREIYPQLFLPSNFGRCYYCMEFLLNGTSKNKTCGNCLWKINALGKDRYNGKVFHQMCGPTFDRLGKEKPGMCMDCRRGLVDLMERLSLTTFCLNCKQFLKCNNYLCKECKTSLEESTQSSKGECSEDLSKDPVEYDGEIDPKNDCFVYDHSVAKEQYDDCREPHPDNDCMVCGVHRENECEDFVCPDCGKETDSQSTCVF